MPAKAKKPKSPFEKARSVEESYARDLRRIAREVGRIIDSFPPGDPAVMPRLMEALRKYAEVLRPWAESRAETMIKALDRQDDVAWRKATEAMSQGLRAELRSAPTGFAMRALLGEQVELITSLPIKAAERVQRLAQEAVVSGSRSKDFIEEIMRSGEVTKARATMIARTETARAASVLTEARARHIGANSYIWRTSRDADVRPTHRKLEGKVFSYDNPPECDPGYHANPGCIWNCRCYAEPIIPDKYG